MSVEAFLDTNVLIYAVSSAPEELAKKETGVGADPDCGFRPFGAGAAGVLCQRDTEDRGSTGDRTWRSSCSISSGSSPWCRRTIPSSSPGQRWRSDSASRIGMAPSSRPLNFWGRRPSIHEDLSHGQEYGSVRVVNPFRLGGADGVTKEGLSESVTILG